MSIAQLIPWPQEILPTGCGRMEFQNIFEATRMQKRSQRAHEPEMEVSGLNWKMNKGVMVNLQGEQYWVLLELL